MSCAHWDRLDLVHFLDEPDAEAFATFREHYPSCATCSTELRVWTELHAGLRHTEDAHPEPEVLLQLVDAPEALPAEIRRRWEAHLDRCPACREETRSLEAYASKPGVPAGPTPSTEHELQEGWPRRIRQVLWSPAFAYAMLIAIAAPLVYLRRDVIVEPMTRSFPAAEHPTMEEPAMRPSIRAEETVAGLPKAAPPPEADAFVPAEPPPRGADAWVAPAPPPAKARSPAAAVPPKDMAKHPAPKRSDRAAAPTRQDAETSASSASPNALPDHAPSNPPRLRALGYMERKPSMDAGAAIPSDALAGAPTSPRRERVTAARDLGTTDSPRELRAERRGQELFLSVPLAAAQERASPVSVRVSNRRGRELRQSFSVQPVQTSIRLRLPADWLGAGPYSLEIENARGEKETWSVSVD